MAKPLRTPPPSSSVARLLDVDAATRAVATPAAPPPTHAQQSMTPAGHSLIRSEARAPGGPQEGAISESIHIKREFILSIEAEETLTRLVDLYRRATGARLSGSHVLRAILKGVAACMGSLDQEVPRIGRLKLPSNARGRESQREAFEDRLAEAFVNAIRAAAAYPRGHK